MTLQNSRTEHFQLHDNTYLCSPKGSSNVKPKATPWVV